MAAAGEELGEEQRLEERAHPVREVAGAREGQQQGLEVSLHLCRKCAAAAEPPGGAGTLADP